MPAKSVRPTQGADVQDVTLALFSRGGVTPDLLELAQTRDDVQLIKVDQMDDL